MTSVNFLNQGRLCGVYRPLQILARGLVSGQKFGVNGSRIDRKSKFIFSISCLSLLPKFGTSCLSSFIQSRSFYRILTAITNRPDLERIKEVGPDRSCAEWLLRCGATVRWKGAETWLKDFNLLPPANFKNYVIEEVEAVEAGIMNIGFDHFDGCKHIRRIRFYHCPYLEDETLAMAVQKLKDSLQHLEISSCGDITERGLSSITQLSHLKTLFLQDLPEVRDKEGIYGQLTAALPQCHIDYTDLKK